MSSDVTRTVGDLPVLPSVLEGRRRLQAEEDVITLGGRGKKVRIDCGWMDWDGAIRTQLPPDSDLHPSPPTQKSAEPLSIMMEKSRSGVPTLTTAAYPTSFALLMVPGQETVGMTGVR